MFTSRRPSYSELVRMTVVPVVLGLAAGIAGALTAESYLAAESFQAPAPIQIGRPSASVTAPLPETEIAERLARVDMPLYARKAATEVADRARSAAEIVGYAAVLTSDGWLATHQSALANPVSVAVGGRLLDPVAQVADPRTGVVFLKIEASALDVGGFEETDVLRVGTPLYAAGDARAFAALTYAGPVPSERKVPAGSLRNSDRFSRAFRFDRALDDRAVGGAVLTAGGNLAGIVAPGASANDVFVPMHLIRPVLAAVFRGQAPARASLGVHYLPLEETVFSGQGFGELPGARLTSSRALGLPATRAGSAALRSGLLDGDVILAIDEVALSGGRDLAELIAEYAPGAKARFEVLRAGERRTLEVTFD